MRCRPAPVSPSTVPVPFVVTGSGEGTVRASVSALDSAGKPLITRSVTLWMATRGSNVFQSTSGSLDAAVRLPGVGTRRPASRRVCRRARPAAGRQVPRPRRPWPRPVRPIAHVAGGRGERLGTGALHRQCRQHPSGAPRPGRDTRRRVRWLGTGHHREHQRHRQLHGHGEQRRRRPRRGGPRHCSSGCWPRAPGSTSRARRAPSASTRRSTTTWPTAPRSADLPAWQLRRPREWASLETGRGAALEAVVTPGGAGPPSAGVTGSRRTGHHDRRRSIRPGRSGRGS